MNSRKMIVHLPPAVIPNGYCGVPALAGFQRPRSDLVYKGVKIIFDVAYAYEISDEAFYAPPCEDAAAVERDAARWRFAREHGLIWADTDFNNGVALCRSGRVGGPFADLFINFRMEQAKR